MQRKIGSNNSEIKRAICKEIGEVLKAARNAKALSQRDVAKITGISVSEIAKLELGQIAPDYMHVLLFEAATGVPGLLESVVKVIRRNFKIEVLEDVKIGMQKMLEYIKEKDEKHS